NEDDRLSLCQLDQEHRNGIDQLRAGIYRRDGWLNSQTMRQPIVKLRDHAHAMAERLQYLFCPYGVDVTVEHLDPGPAGRRSAGFPAAAPQDRNGAFACQDGQPVNEATFADAGLTTDEDHAPLRVNSVVQRLEEIVELTRSPHDPVFRILVPSG